MSYPSRKNPRRQSFNATTSGRWVQYKESPGRPIKKFLIERREDLP